MYADLRRVDTYSLIVAHHDRSVGFRHLAEPVRLRAGDALLFLAPLCHFGTALQKDASRVSMSHAFLGPGILLYDMRPSKIHVHGCGHDDNTNGDANDVLITWHPVFKQSGALDDSPESLRTTCAGVTLADSRGAALANGGGSAVLKLGGGDGATLELADGGCATAMLLADGNGAGVTLVHGGSVSTTPAYGGGANGTLTRAVLSPAEGEGSYLYSNLPAGYTALPPPPDEQLVAGTPQARQLVGQSIFIRVGDPNRWKLGVIRPVNKWARKEINGEPVTHMVHYGDGTPEDPAALIECVLKRSTYCMLGIPSPEWLLLEKEIGFKPPPRKRRWPACSFVAAPVLVGAHPQRQRTAVQPFRVGDNTDGLASRAR